MKVRKSVRVVNTLPTLFTLGNLICGFFAIVVSARIEKPVMPEGVKATAQHFYEAADPTNCMIAAVLIFAAMVFDAFDGQLARLSRSTSEFGGQLDSLCDLVSFGVAPAFLLVKMCPFFTVWHPKAIWIIAALFVAFVAMRLARFNVETDEDDDHAGFSGLPSPAGGAAIASFAFLFHALRNDAETMLPKEAIDGWVQWILPVYAVIVAFLMVSRIPYPHLANNLFRGQKSFGHVIGVVFLIAVIALVRGYAIPIVCMLFVLYGPVVHGWNLLLGRQPKPREEATQV